MKSIRKLSFSDFCVEDFDFEEFDNDSYTEKNNQRSELPKSPPRKMPKVSQEKPVPEKLFKVSCSFLNEEVNQEFMETFCAEFTDFKSVEIIFRENGFRHAMVYFKSFLAALKFANFSNDKLGFQETHQEENLEKVVKWKFAYLYK